MVSDRDGRIAPRRREYKWRAPAVKNPSKNVARRVKGHLLRGRTPSVAPRAKVPPTLFLSLSFYRPSRFIFRERLQIRNESEEVRYIAERIVAYLIEKLFSLPRLVRACVYVYARARARTRGRATAREKRRGELKIVRGKRRRIGGESKERKNALSLLPNSPSSVK